MPNWCFNDLTVCGKKKELQKFLDAFTEDNPEHPEDKGQLFTFAKIVPPPANEADHDYKWRMDNWGTKWDINVSDNVQVNDTPDEECFSCSIDTAWTPCDKFIIACIKKFPKLTFGLDYLEPGMDFCGSVEGRDGIYQEEFLDHIPEELMKEWGLDVEDEFTDEGEEE